jgi:hypothetical protein
LSLSEAEGCRELSPLGQRQILLALKYPIQLDQIAARVDRPRLSYLLSSNLAIAIAPVHHVLLAAAVTIIFVMMIIVVVVVVYDQGLFHRLWQERWQW